MSRLHPEKGSFCAQATGFGDFALIVIVASSTQSLSWKSSKMKAVQNGQLLS
jgi:hypothetical protein